jgi:hypothetical protein
VKHQSVVTAIASLLIVPIVVTAQDSGIKQIAARIELHSIQSVTLSDEQFLKGDGGGKQVTVSGQLRIAQGSGRLPTLVMIHGRAASVHTLTSGRKSLTKWVFRPSFWMDLPGAALRPSVRIKRFLGGSI